MLLTLYLVILLNSLISSSSFFHRFLRIFYVPDYLICKYSFTSFFPFCLPFIYLFFHLVVLARNSKFCIEVESRPSCLFPSIRGKMLSLSSLNVTLAIDFFIDAIYHCWARFHLLQVWVLNPVRCFSPHLSGRSYGFSLLFW